MRFKTYINEENKKIKSGDWVKGEAEQLTTSTAIDGIFIAQTGSLSLIATKLSDGKKKYVRISNITKIEKPNNSPKDLLTFAKKHSMWGLKNE